jgi:hypothetical protein
MLLALEYLPLSLFGPGGILFLLTAVVSFLVARRAGRITPLHWILAILFNLPTVVYVLLGDLSHSSVMMYLVLGYGLGGFGMGWLLGILACWSSWRLGNKTAS